MLGTNSGVATLDANGKVTASQTSARVVSVSSSTKTLSASDAGCLLAVSVSSTITIPSSLAAGTEIEILNYGSNITITITPASGVNLNGASSSKTLATQYTSAVLKAITASDWVIQGAIS